MSPSQLEIMRQGIKVGMLSKLAGDEGLFDAMMKETGVGLGTGLLGGAGFGLADQLLDKKQKELNAKQLLLTALASGVGGGIGGALGGGAAYAAGFPATSWQGMALSKLPVLAGSYLATKAKDRLLESEPVRLGHQLIQKVT
jgi:hypothetical protein